MIGLANPLQGGMNVTSSPATQTGMMPPTPAPAPAPAPAANPLPQQQFNVGFTPGMTLPQQAAPQAQANGLGGSYANPVAMQYIQNLLQPPAAPPATPAPGGPGGMGGLGGMGRLDRMIDRFGRRVDRGRYDPERMMERYARRPWGEQFATLYDEAGLAAPTAPDFSTATSIGEVRGLFDQFRNDWNSYQGQVRDLSRDARGMWHDSRGQERADNWGDRDEDWDDDDWMDRWRDRRAGGAQGGM